jgi:hypothetical protein
MTQRDLTQASAANDSSDRIGVAPQLWIYFVIAVPLTVLTVGTLWMWDRKRNRKSKRVTAALEEGLEHMEMEIASQMKRQRVGTKTSTPTKNDLDDF